MRNLTWLALSDFLEEFIAKIEISTSTKGFRATMVVSTQFDVEYIIADAKTVEQAVSQALVSARAVIGVLRRAGETS